MITFQTFALSGTTDSTTLNITLPTVEPGDIMCLGYTHRGTGTGTLGGAGGSGWTNKLSRTYNTSFSAHLYWKRCDGSEDGQALTVTGLTNSCAGVLTLYRGCIESGDPIEAATSEENAAANETHAAITTLTNGAWVVLTVANSPDLDVTTQSTTSPGALTERAERLNITGTDTSISHASAEKALAGTTGALTWAQTDGVSASFAYALTPAMPTIATPVGALAVVGLAFGLAFTGPAEGRLAYTGYAPLPIVQAGTTITLPAGSLVYTGRAPTLAGTIAIPAGALRFTGAAPGTLQGVNVSIPAGALTLAGRTLIARLGLLRVGLDANALAPTLESYTEAAQREGYHRASLAGVDYIHYAKTWNQVETADGIYDWTDLVWRLEEHTSPGRISITITAVNYDGTKTLPTYLGAVAFNHATVLAAYNAMLDDLLTVIGDRVEYVSLGQEVEVYFGANPTEIDEFAALIDSAKTKVTALWPGRPTIVSFKSATAAVIPTTYADILNSVTLPGITYYFINGDFTVRDSNPGTINGTIEDDILAIFVALGGTQPIILTELGCPSHADLGSSEAIQSQFLAHALTVCQVWKDLDLLTHVSIEWQYDWDEWLLDSLGLTGDARKYIGTLGLRRTDGSAKPGFVALVSYLDGSIIEIEIPRGAISLAGRALFIASTVAIPVGSISLTGLAPSSSGAFTIPIPAGALVLTGAAPSLGASPTIAIPAGSLAWTGRAFTLDFVLPVPAGSLVWAGRALSIGGLTAIDIPAGSLVLSGQTVDIAFIGPGSGQLRFTGYAPLAVVGDGSVAIPIPVGSLRYTGQSPLALSDRTIAIPAGALNIVGQYIGIAFIDPPAGQLRFTGYAPSIVVSGTVSIPAGSLAFTGRVPVVQTAFTIAMPVGRVLLTGQAPSTGGAVTISTPVGACVLTGYALSLTGTGQIAIPAGSLAFTGRTSTVHLDVVIITPAGALTITGRTLAVVSSIAVPSGSLVWTGRIPALVGAGDIAISSGALSLAGYAPSLVFAFTVPVPAGSLRLTGQASSVLVDHPVPVGVGALALTGKVPALMTGVVVPIGAGALRFSSEPSVVLGAGSLTVQVPVGALRFTGSTSTVILNAILPTDTMIVVGADDIVVKVGADDVVLLVDADDGTVLL